MCLFIIHVLELKPKGDNITRWGLSHDDSAVMGLENGLRRKSAFQLLSCGDTIVQPLQNM